MGGNVNLDFIKVWLKSIDCYTNLIVLCVLGHDSVRVLVHVFSFHLSLGIHVYVVFAIQNEGILRRNPLICVRCQTTHRHTGDLAQPKVYQ